MASEIDNCLIPSKSTKSVCIRHPVISHSLSDEFSLALLFISLPAVSVIAFGISIKQQYQYGHTDIVSRIKLFSSHGKKYLR